MRKGLDHNRHKRRRIMAAQSTLKQYHVTYLAAGDTRDYGVHSALTAYDAVTLAIKIHDSKQDQQRIRGCLTAREIK